MKPINRKNKPVILLAEDDEHISYLLEFLLGRNGYELRVAEDGFKFLDIIKDGLPPDLVILDLMLPYVDGFELILQMRNLPDWKDIPIIALSSLSQDEDIVRAFKNGVSDYMTKPFQPQELLARIDRFVNYTHERASGEI